MFQIDASTQLMIVTPAKDEARNLRRLATSIIEQNVRPQLWIIVDDASTDSTPTITRKLEREHNWVRALRIPGGAQGDLDRYGYVVRTGFDYGVSISKKEGLVIKYLGVVDADVLPEREYFEKTIKAFQRDEKLGITSGIMYDRQDGALVPYKSVWNEYCVRGAALLFRAKCYDDIGGFPLTMGPDSVAIVKAMKRRWRVQVTLETAFVHMRPSKGWRRYFKLGEHEYVQNYFPLNAALTSIYYLVREPPTGIAYLFGYMKGLVTRARKIEDPEVRDYFGRESFSRLLKRLPILRGTREEQHGCHR